MKLFMFLKPKCSKGRRFHTAEVTNQAEARMFYAHLKRRRGSILRFIAR